MPAVAVAVAASFAAETVAWSVAASFAISTAAFTAIQIGVAFAINAIGATIFAPKIPQPAGRELQDRKQMVRGSVEPRRIVYGRCMVSGPLVAAFSTGDNHEYLHLVVALAGHEIDAIEEIWLGDVQLPAASGSITSGHYADQVRVNPHLGADDQMADADLIAECGAQGWTSAHRLRGVAYLYIRLHYAADVFPTGIPAVRAVVRGKKVYDPRTATTAWSDNLALVVRDWLTSTDGLRCAAEEIDDAAAIVAANLCDEAVSVPGGGTQARYTANGTITLDARPIDTIKHLLSAGAASLVYSQGAYRIAVGAYATPTITLDEDDLRGALKVRPRASRKDLFNGVKGTYSDATRQWQASEFPVVKSATYAVQDGGEEILRDVEYPFTTDGFAAQRLAKISLEKSRQGITVEFPAKLIGFRVAVGDTVNLSIGRMGWSTKPFKVMSWKMSQDAGVDLVLQEEAASCYAWSSSDAIVIDTAPDTDLPSAFTVAAPTGLAIDWGDATGQLLADGTFVPRMLITWDATPAMSYELQWQRDGGDWASITTQASSHTLTLAVIGAAYAVRVRAVNWYGVRSPWATATPAAYTAFTGVISGLSANAVTGSSVLANITWTAVSGADRYLVDQSSDGATWQRTGETRSTTWADSALYGAATQFRVAAVRGNQGPWSAPAYLSIDYITFWPASDASPFWPASDSAPFWPE